MAKETCCICGEQPNFFSLNYVSATKDKEWVCKKCLEKAGIENYASQHTLEEIKQCINEKNIHDALISNFVITDNLCLLAKFNEEAKEMILARESFYVPENEQADGHKKRPDVYELFSYNQIVDFELLENGESIASGGLGRAAVGGVLFGGAGAVVGAASRSYKGICSELKIKITVKNYKEPAYYMVFIGSETQKTGDYYKQKLKMAHDVLSKFHLITDSMPKADSSEINFSKNKFDEIREYKSLLDEGIISQEEFEKKKKELLDL